MTKDKKTLKNMFLEKDLKELLHMMQSIHQNTIINKYMIHLFLQ